MEVDLWGEPLALGFSNVPGQRETRGRWNILVNCSEHLANESAREEKAGARPPPSKESKRNEFCKHGHGIDVNWKGKPAAMPTDHSIKVATGGRHDPIYTHDSAAKEPAARTKSKHIQQYANQSKAHFSSELQSRRVHSCPVTNGRRPNLPEYEWELHKSIADVGSNSKT